MPKGENKKVIRLAKDELDGKISTIFLKLRAKICSILIDDGSETKKERGTKGVSKKENLNFKILRIV